jgi:hypothetical protein
MGYFDGLVASTFTTDGRGNYFVSPYGVAGKARRFRTEQDYVAARSFLIGSYKVALPLIIVTCVSARTIGWLAAPIMLGLLVLWAAVVFPRITRNSEPAVHESHVDRVRRTANAHSGARLALMTLMSAAFAAGGVVMAANGFNSGYLAAAFFGLCTIIWGAMLILRR